MFIIPQAAVFQVNAAMLALGNQAAIVGAHDNRHPKRIEPLQNLQHSLRIFWIEVAGGLIRQQ